MFHLTSAISPRSKLFALSCEEGYSVDVERRSSSFHSYNVVVFEDYCVSFDLVFENIMNTSMQDTTLNRVTNIKGPYEALNIWYKVVLKHFNLKTKTAF
jgi:hypothetical protein